MLYKSVIYLGSATCMFTMMIDELEACDSAVIHIPLLLLVINDQCYVKTCG